MHRQCSDRHKAFTLIELLVVVAIIVLLVSLLTPVLRLAWDAGRATVC
jgi:prepilin-type N-terminal cleavage/methylation domain-containing protein